MPITDTYLVGAPGLDITAEVSDAPSTRHARTAFLDYLTRSHRIPYTQRKTVRSVVWTKRVQPGQVATNVQLSYGGGNQPVPEQLDFEGPAPVEQPNAEPEQVDERYEEQPTAPPMSAPRQTGGGFENSPVYRMSKNFGRQ